MLVMELLINYNGIDANDKHTKRQADKYFMQIETDLNNLKYELNQVQEIYKNIDPNINNFLNDVSILQALIIGYCHFKKCYNIYNDVDIITDNKKVFLITKEHIKTIKEVIKYYELILKEMKNKANKTQLKNMDKYYKHYK